MKYLCGLFLFLLIWTVIISVSMMDNAQFIEDIDITEKTIETENLLSENDKLYIIENIDSEIMISVYEHTDDSETGEVKKFKIEEYLTGVVYAEMPASFEIEALKAQAVAARSFCFYKMVNSTEESRAVHNGADVCNDFAHCKAYMSYEEACEKYGEDNVKSNWEKVNEAVKATQGEIITYDQEPAIAVFHAISDKNTESAKDVWGGDIPYLVSVYTPEDENVKNFSVETKMTSKEFKSTLTKNNFKGKIPNSPTDWIETITYNDAERVDSVKICGVNMTGLWFRNIFSLRSTSFDIEYNSDTDEFVITTRGYGHGVGMSQYGANLMAMDGEDYVDILKWYYTDIEIDTMENFINQ